MSTDFYESDFIFMNLLVLTPLQAHLIVMQEKAFLVGAAQILELLS